MHHFIPIHICGIGKAQKLDDGSKTKSNRTNPLQLRALKSTQSYFCDVYSETASLTVELSQMDIPWGCFTTKSKRAQERKDLLK